jgi:hypothetical protein
LVTGSLSGVGFATAKALADADCDVMLNGFADAVTIAAGVAEIEAREVRAAYHNADPGDPAQIAALIETTTQARGAPDILVDNAVVRYFGAVENFAGTVLTPAIERRLRQEMLRVASSSEDAEADFLAIRQPSRCFIKDAYVAGPIALLCGPLNGDINGAALPIHGNRLTGRQTSAHGFPVAGLDIQAVVLQPTKIAARDDAHDLAILDDRDMPEAAIAHHPQGVDRMMAGRHRMGVGGHR